MLFMAFQLGSDRYAIEGRRLVEILPLVQIKAVPGAPAGIAGLINYRGVPVPAIDVCAALLGRPARRRLNTRVLVVSGDNVGEASLALVAEEATETIRLDPAQFIASPVTSGGAPCLGRVAADASGRLVQWIEVDRLLTPAMRDALARERVSP